MTTQIRFKYLAMAFIATIAISANCSQDKKINTKIQEKIDNGTMIPTAGNSWIVNNIKRNNKIIGSEGIESWRPSSDTIRTFLHTNTSGVINLGIRAKARSGISKIKVQMANHEVTVPIENQSFSKIVVGEFSVAQPGYQQIDIIGTDGNEGSEIDISHVIVAGIEAADELIYVKDDFYWGRRGPSVHLRYDIPESAGPIRYFYNEITVPKGEDVLGSYFMANGFGQGYFGIQVNSETERRILFSVWSPFETDNPDEIPEDMRIKLLKKGEDVYAGEFGNEGSGGQSYRKYMWEAGTTYKFLLKGEPVTNNSTRFTAWFFIPENDQWELIASFERPKTSTNLTGLHSFLENFNTTTGFLGRTVHYSNQWAIDTAGRWHELTGAVFTADATARKDARVDYAGGTKNGKFFLQNCGFFSETVPIDSEFSRKAHDNKPQIDLNNLP